MKRIFALCLALCLLAGLGTLYTFAETETDITVKYGKADLALTLIDPFDEEKQLPGFMNWGNGYMQDGRIYMECAGGNLYDIYNLTTVPLMENPTISDNTYIVFAAENTSDGDIFFGFQPDVYYNDSTIHAYLSSELAKNNPVKLIYKDGTVKDAKFWNQRSAGREVFAVPYEFDGYIAIPHAILATEIESTTPVTTDGKVDYVGYGLHALPDDASYMEFTITAAYACSTLPAYEAPEKPVETEKPAESTPAESTPAESTPVESTPTETETQPESKPVETLPESETVAETLPESADAVDTAESVTTAETKPETDAPADTGCVSVVGLSAALLLVAAGGVCLRRREND